LENRPNLTGNYGVFPFVENVKRRRRRPFKGVGSRRQRRRW